MLAQLDQRETELLDEIDKLNEKLDNLKLAGNVTKKVDNSDDEANSEKETEKLYVSNLFIFV